MRPSPAVTEGVAKKRAYLFHLFRKYLLSVPPFAEASSLPRLQMLVPDLRHIDTWGSDTVIHTTTACGVYQRAHVPKTLCRAAPACMDWRLLTRLSSSRSKNDRRRGKAQEAQDGSGSSLWRGRSAWNLRFAKELELFAFSRIRSAFAYSSAADRCQEECR